MRRATSGHAGRQGVGGWIWTGFAVEPGPVPVGLAPRRLRLWRVRMATNSGQSVPLGDGNYSPFCFAMISLATFAGTSL